MSITLYPKKDVSRDAVLVGKPQVYLGRIGAALPSLDPTSGTTLDFLSLGTNDVQTLTISGGPSSGTYIINYWDKEGVRWQTSALAYNANAAAIQAALVALTPIGTLGAVVTGTGPWTITFSGALTKAAYHNLMTATDTFDAGDVAIAHTTEGVSNWVRPGYTENGLGQEISVTTEEKEVDEEIGVIWADVSKVDCKFMFELSERDAAAWMVAIGTATRTTQLQASAAAGRHTIGFGGRALNQFQFAALGLSPAGLPMLYHHTICVSVGNASTKWEKAKRNNIPVEVKCLADFEQPEGQELFSIYQLNGLALA